MSDKAHYSFSSNDLQQLGLAIDLAIECVNATPDRFVNPDGYVEWLSYLSRDVTDQMRGLVTT